MEKIKEVLDYIMSEPRKAEVVFDRDKDPESYDALYMFMLDKSAGSFPHGAKIILSSSDQYKWIPEKYSDSLLVGNAFGRDFYAEVSTEKPNEDADAETE